MLTQLVCYGVALLHTCFFLLESILWEKPMGRKVFQQSVENAKITAPLAKNQGVYNLFLAAGLVWGNLYGGIPGEHIQLFFLGCVVVAALVGAVTVSPRILLVQGGPAILGLVLLALGM